MDYGKTLNLPKTDFPMRGGLLQKEPEILKKWQDEDIYNKRLKRNEGNEKFILHDGPPYANGEIHLGTALNKVLKDIILRYKDMKGYYTPYVPGWDTHGLPTENCAIDELGLNRHETGYVRFRQACEKIALKYLDIQRKSFRRLGVIGDWITRILPCSLNLKPNRWRFSEKWHREAAYTRVFVRYTGVLFVKQRWLKQKSNIWMIAPSQSMLNLK